jgi:hypothetical protein
MKKLIITAIAIVAFSEISMANTLEEKEVVVVSIELQVQEGDMCQEFAMDYIDEYDANNPGEEMDAITANNAYQELLDLCYTYMG